MPNVRFIRPGARWSLWSLRVAGRPGKPGRPIPQILDTSESSKTTEELSGTHVACCTPHLRGGRSASQRRTGRSRNAGARVAPRLG